MTRGLLLAGMLLGAPAALAWNVHCERNGVECANGFDRARTPWAAHPDNEHRTLLERTIDLAGLPATLHEPIALRVYTKDESVPGGFGDSLRPLRQNAEREHVRTTSIPEMAALPDMSYTLWDWASGNEGCPPDPANQSAFDCHNYETHIGWLNSNHMLPQARRWYEHLHALAVRRAQSCRTVHDALPAAHRERFRPWLLACERLALVIEGVGHHYLQDAWSSGHMWERWGGTEPADFLDRRTLGFAVAAFTGTIHGAGAMLGEGFDDPLCAPHADVEYLDPAPEIPGIGTMVGQGLLRPGVGDVYAPSFLFERADYAPQRRALFGCAVNGLREVYAATAQVHGGMQSVSGDFDSHRSVRDDSCWGQRATNRALAAGCGLHQGVFPDQQRLLGVVTGEDVASVLAFALSSAALDIAGFGLSQLSPADAEAFKADAAYACTLAAAAGADPATADDTDLASGGLPALAGVAVNSFYARGGGTSPSTLPATYADPFLPWTLDDPDAARRERTQALNLTFADAHVADRCRELTEIDLLAYRVAVQSVAELGDDVLTAARCGQCEQMVAPHLRFGVSGDHDARREALCAFVEPSAAFVHTEEDPATFTGDEDTSLEALRVATRRWCGCGTVELTAAFPSAVTPETDVALRIDVGEETASGSEPLPGVFLEIAATGGTVASPTGTTDADGAFETTARLTGSAAVLTLAIVARDAPGGTEIARASVTATRLEESLLGTWIGRFSLTGGGLSGEGCAGAGIVARDDGLQVFVCTDDWCQHVTAFGFCAPVFEVTATGSDFSGLMTTHTGPCCRGCAGQNRGWEQGCTLSGGLVSGQDGQVHLVASFDTHISFCGPGFATTSLDLVRPGAPRCGDCQLQSGEDCEPPGTAECDADCRFPPSEEED